MTTETVPFIYYSRCDVSVNCEDQTISERNLRLKTRAIVFNLVVVFFVISRGHELASFTGTAGESWCRITSAICFTRSETQGSTDTVNSTDLHRKVTSDRFGVLRAYATESVCHSTFSVCSPASLRLSSRFFVWRSPSLLISICVMAFRFEWKTWLCVGNTRFLSKSGLLWYFMSFCTVVTNQGSFSVIKRLKRCCAL